MPYSRSYVAQEPSRPEVNALPGVTVLEFGAPWCGFCVGAQPSIASALEGFDGVRHIKVEDGRGRPLGRSFAVKLWPTLIVLRDGEQIAKFVRPDDGHGLRDALRANAD